MPLFLNMKVGPPIDALLGRALATSTLSATGRSTSPWRRKTKTHGNLERAWAETLMEPQRSYLNREKLVTRCALTVVRGMSSFVA